MNQPLRHKATPRAVDRPLERVEIDASRIDLISLLDAAGLLEQFGDEERARLELLDASKPSTLSVALCAASRCVLAMRLGPVEDEAESALQTLDMATRDKGQWAEATGALSPWPMAGLPETVVTDNGAGVQSPRFRKALADLGIAHEVAIRGGPAPRTLVERLFHKMAIDLAPHLLGQSLSKILLRGSCDAMGPAALTRDDLTFALVRWVVDVYHDSPQAGLGGQTPRARWQELVETRGVRPAPDMRTRRIVFGTALERVAVDRL